MRGDRYGGGQPDGCLGQLTILTSDWEIPPEIQHLYDSDEYAWLRKVPVSWLLSEGIVPKSASRLDDDVMSVC